MEKVKNRGVEKRRFQRLDCAVQVRVTILVEEEDLSSPKSFIAKVIIFPWRVCALKQGKLR